MKKYLVLILLLFLFPISNVVAQNKEQKPHKLYGKVKDINVIDTIVVTATRTEKKVDEAPASVTVITREDIKKYNIQSLEDAIKREAGAWVNSASGGKVSMRGLNGQNRTLVLLNGMPLNDGYSGSVDWKTIGIDNVKQIEIIRGGGSALYGGNAMGGVINIITTKPEKMEAGIHGGYGSDNTYKYGVFFGNRFDRFRIRAGYEAETTDGYPTSLVTRSISSGAGTLTGGYETTDRAGNQKWVCGDKGDANNERSNLNLMVSYDVTDTGSLQFNFQRGTNFKDYGRPNTYLTDASGNPSFLGRVDAGGGNRASVLAYNYLASPFSMEDYIGSLTYKDSFGNIDFTAMGGYKTTDTWYTSASYGATNTYDNAPGTKKEHDTETWTADLQADIPLWDRHFLTVGTSFKTDNYDSDSYKISYFRDENSTLDRIRGTQGNVRFFAFYLQDEWNITDQFTLYGGARFDYWKAYDGKSGNVGSLKEFIDVNDNAISPQIAAVWNPLADTYIRSSAAKAFRAPTIYELFGTLSIGSRTYHNNPDLKPETTWTYEAGVDQYVFTRKMKVSATYFYTQAEDLIGSYQKGSDIYKENVGEADIQGLELEVSVNPLDWLNIWANYTSTDSEVKKNDRDPDTVGKHLTYYPERTINMGCDLTYKWFKVSLAGNYLGRIYKSELNDDMDDVYGAYSKRWLWDTKLTYSPVEYLECSLSVDNIFDKEYFVTDVGRGRSYFFEMALKF